MCGMNPCEMINREMINAAIFQGDSLNCNVYIYVYICKKLWLSFNEVVFARTRFTLCFLVAVLDIIQVTYRLYFAAINLIVRGWLGSKHQVIIQSSQV